ncbi:hypothetical protein C8Q69DRAFT_473720 [Paecilomyces variotii]|uniref:Uncharacterized protein n=1 Tax=Byssochlamys spectabilis TaxID=264951 RepID=A0A443HNT7_BYSSP|nr:hypothetical protein C8Q69DRAFT_473720 [Paecilomyces variotii]RWQ93478.1 hypothetical protein C8Q69DRAFT_473720 [Paecilomyces variotii]
MPISDDIVKAYPPRGSLQQYRLSQSTNFQCTRCKQDKKAKLVTIIDGNWDNLLCNACYGNILASGKPLVMSQRKNWA